MRLASFVHNGRASWGVVTGDHVIDASGVAATLKDFCALGDFAALNTLTSPFIELADISFVPVIPGPDKILCVGVNYHEHRIETGRTENAYPTIFTRFANSQAGHLAPIIRPNASVELDYEGELAVIIGRPGRHIKAADALSHIAGFACYNDGSVRDFQRHSHQFTPGKNFIATGGFGPAIIEYISIFTRLEPGDVIVTGTPGGVGAKRTPPLWLKPGDVVEVEIENIGTLQNPVIAETL